MLLVPIRCATLALAVSSFGAVVPVARADLPADCGRENQRPCNFWEHFPSCGPGLLEWGATCVDPAKSSIVTSTTATVAQLTSAADTLSTNVWQSVVGWGANEAVNMYQKGPEEYWKQKLYLGLSALDWVYNNTLARILGVCQIDKNGFFEKAAAAWCADGFYYNACTATCRRRIARRPAASAPLDVTFYVATDLHYQDAEDLTNPKETIHTNGILLTQLQYPDAAVANWPQTAGTVQFPSAGKPIGPPAFVVITGDMVMDWNLANWNKWKGQWVEDATALPYPVFPGFGNHDLEQATNQATYLDWLRKHVDGNPDVTSVHQPSASYSWDYGPLHLVQMNRFPGDHMLHESALDWLADDLKASVGTSNRPVIIFAHYGFDCFSMGQCAGGGDDWAGQGLTGPQARQAFYDVVKDYNLIAYISGHKHNPGEMGTWAPTPGAKPIYYFTGTHSGDTEGNGDDPPTYGGYLVVHVTDTTFEIVHRNYRVVNNAMSSIAFRPALSFVRTLAPWVDDSAPNRYAPGAEFLLKNDMAGTCLNVAGGSSALGTPVNQFNCDPGNAANVWTVVGSASGRLLKNRMSGTCLNVAGGPSALGANALMFTCDANNQANLWQWLGADEAKQLRNQMAGTCLNVENGSAALGARALQYACDPDNAANRWRAVPVPAPLGMARETMEPRLWSNQPGTLASIAAGGGAVWGLGDSGGVWVWYDSTWHPVAGNLRQIAVGSPTRVWGVDANGQIYNWQNGAWVNIPGALRRIAVGADGTVVGVNDSNGVYRRVGNGWEVVPGTLKSVSVGDAANIWGIDPVGGIYRWQGAWPSGAWQHVDGVLSEIAAGPGGDVVGINADGETYRYTGTRWQRVAGTLAHIATAGGGYWWGLGSTGTVWTSTDTGAADAWAYAAKVAVPVYELSAGGAPGGPFYLGRTPLDGWPVRHLELYAWAAAAHPGLTPIKRIEPDGSAGSSYDWVTGEPPSGWHVTSTGEFFVFADEQAGTVPIYRQHDPVAGTVHLTTWLTPELPGYVNDGVAFYALSPGRGLPTGRPELPDLHPVWRETSPLAPDALYNFATRGAEAAADSGWALGPVAFYAFDEPGPGLVSVNLEERKGIAGGLPSALRSYYWANRSGTVADTNDYRQLYTPFYAFDTPEPGTVPVYHEMAAPLVEQQLTLQNQMAGTCLNVAGGSSALATPVVQFNCDPANTANLWSWVGTGTDRLLRNTMAGTCLNVAGGSTAVGAAAHMFNCDAGNAANLWRWVGTDGARQLQNAMSGTCLNVAEGSTALGAKVLMNTCDGGNGANLWTPFPAVAGNRYRLATGAVEAGWTRTDVAFYAYPASYRPAGW